MDTLKAVLHYPDGHTPVPCGDRVNVYRDGKPITKVSFSTIGINSDKSIGPPALPILAYGEIQHVGWDIPSYYAVDSDFRCYMNNAHGHPMYPCSTKQLIELVRESKEDLEAVKAALKINVEEKVCPHCKGTGKI